MEPVAAALARLSKAQAKCAEELYELADSHAGSPAWASAGIAAVVRLCHDPAAAADAARSLSHLSAADDANDGLIREAGAIPPLIAMLAGGPESEAAGVAAEALGNLVNRNVANRAAVEKAGAIPPLVAMLSGGPESEPVADAARALRSLAESNEAARAAIVEAGAIPPLVALLGGGPESETAACAAGALWSLTADGEGGNAIVEAGAISPLVALLRGGPESGAALRAAGALQNLAAEQNLAADTNATAVLEEVVRTQTDCSFSEGLQENLRVCASEQLQAAEAGTAVAALEHAITLAAAVPVDATAVERAQARLREINGDAERQERRESFGLGSLALPDEFMCPITMDKMRGVPPPPLPPQQRSRTAAARVPRLKKMHNLRPTPTIARAAADSAPLAPQTRWWRRTAIRTSGRPSSLCSATATA